MIARIPDIPPVILPLSKGISRPLWSVMIPVYNCIQYLGEALECVLLQDPGPDKMQIEVIDDCSIDGDVAALVNEIGQGRIEYYRQPINQGSLRNFETCISRAKGIYVHLLHGDDKVKGGFYQEIESLFDLYPEAGAAFTRHMVLDELSNRCINGKVISDVIGPLPDWLCTIAQRNCLQPPAIVVKRSVYEQIGSFYAVQFGEDWEMWVRIASKFSFVYSPKCLAVYRRHFNNTTSYSFLSGRNVSDLKKVINIIQSYLPDKRKDSIIRVTTKNTSKYIARTANLVFHRYNDPRAALMQANEALKIHLNIVSIRLVFKVYIKYFCYPIRNSIKNKVRKHLGRHNQLKNRP